MQDPKSGRKHRITSAEPLTLEIAHIGGKELFAWPGEGPFESRSAAAMVGGGLTDTGGFSAFARSIFVDNDSCYQTVAVVKFRGKEDWRGRDAVRYDYSVGSFLAGYTVRTLSGTAKLGYSGSFWVDPQTNDLFELAVRADGIPAYLDVAEVLTVIDCGNTKPGGSPALLLPQSVRTSMRYTSGDVSENLTDFTNCRQFTAESSISFDPLPEDARRPAQNIETITLPPGLMIATRLVTAVDATAARVGDPVSARVETAASARHRVWLPEGAILHGRVRRVEKFASPAESVLIGLEFTGFSFEIAAASSSRIFSVRTPRPRWTACCPEEPPAATPPSSCTWAWNKAPRSRPSRIANCPA